MALTLTHASADVFVPDGSAIEDALHRTTHLAIGAHQDDLEFMAAHGVVECFQNPARWFTGVGARESADGEHYAFDVWASLPLVGLLVHYTGWLDVRNE